MTDLGPRLLQLKMLLRDVHPAVWRRVRLADELSIAELHRVIQILMGWDDDHLHRFRIHGRAWPRLRQCLYRRTELRRGRRCRATVVVRVPSHGAVFLRIRFYGWMADRGAGRAGNPGSTARESSIPVCIAGRQAGPPDGCGGPQAYAERR